MAQVLPPKMSAAAFDRACKELRSVVGDGWVFTEPLDMAAYYDPYATGNAEQFAPSGAVAPANVAEIQSVLKVANRYALPLWTVSTGKNYVYGGAAPCLRGSVVLDLKRMKGITVNEDLAYAIVEPGVSYFDLYRYLQASKSGLWIDCPTPGWGSVMGNALDRGQGYTPYAEHASFICGMEVLLANGELIRTGMGAMADNPSWALYRYGYGPGIDGLFVQSNLGVVTKLGIWLMPAPDAYASVEINFANESDLVPVVDTLRRLRLDDTVPPASIANWMRSASARTTRARWYDGKGAMPPSAIEKLMKALDVSHWRLRYGLYGTEEMVALKYKRAQEVFGRIEGARFKQSTYVRGQEIPDADKASAGIPTLNFGILNWMGGAGAHIECPPVLPMDGKICYEYYRKKTELYAQYGFDHYCGMTTMSQRAFINTGSIIFDRGDSDQTRRARELETAAIKQAASFRFGGYRAHIADMDLAASTFDFNGQSMRRLCERLKDELDPKGILSPGKQGIWPRTLRGVARKGGA